MAVYIDGAERLGLLLTAQLDPPHRTPLRALRVDAKSWNMTELYKQLRMNGEGNRGLHGALDILKVHGGFIAYGY